LSFDSKHFFFLLNLPFFNLLAPGFNQILCLPKFTQNLFFSPFISTTFPNLSNFEALSDSAFFLFLLLILFLFLDFFSFNPFLESAATESATFLLFAAKSYFDTPKTGFLNLLLHPLHSGP
jgi:hypothetical protein